jgi:uncharacterized membrane protein
MSLPELFQFPTVVVAIDMIGAFFIVCYAISSVTMLIRGRGVAKARLVMAEGAVFGLSFKAAGTLLKTLELHTWEQILMFATILTLRTILKQLFSWEKQRLQGKVTV